MISITKYLEETVSSQNEENTNNKSFLDKTKEKIKNAAIKAKDTGKAAISVVSDVAAPLGSIGTIAAQGGHSWGRALQYGALGTDLLKKLTTG
jgi:hypothetical protein